ncbi:hypothetical protein LuPra_02877 [Luteitalea pratensis]|uniref:Uncharacterized protein n=1 Tax=Luteitalea pratensis TaxID=1855912 RepID=A0A143PM23_LUTPR|nr:hypothetical protein [Luteitalea pratensis]AMY09655.1 hypothetical protein LuPra_02877 [Luteitalea pratensis]
MTTLFVMGFAMVAMLVVTGLALAWAALRAVLWVVFLPLMLLKALFGLVFGLFGLVFGLVFGTLGLVVGLLVALVVGGVGLVALLAVVAIPLVPFLLVAGLVWVAVKGTTALAAV